MALVSTAMVELFKTDGDNGDIRPYRRLKVQTNHPECSVTHEVDANLFRLGKLGAYDQAQAGAQPMGLAPTQVAPGAVGLVKRHDLVPGTPRVVGYDRVLRADSLHEIPYHPIGVDGTGVIGKFGRPIPQPGVPLGLYFPGYSLVVPPVLPNDVAAGINHLSQDQLGVTHQRPVYVVILVDVPGVVGALNQYFAGGMFMHMPCLVKLVPMPNITSARRTKW